MSADKKRAQTSYGTVEYDTLQCAECTNETVTSEITHLISTPTEQNAKINASSIVVHPVCTGCVGVTYGSDVDVDVLDHDTLCQFYAEIRSEGGGFPLTAGTPETTTTSAPTIHGNVDVTVAHCSRCEGEWTFNDLRAVHIPLAIVDGEIHAQTCLYCPDCREIDVTAIESEGATLQDVINSEGNILSSDEEDEDHEEASGSALKQAAVMFAGGVLTSIILSAIHPLLGGVWLSLCVPIAVYFVYRHFAGLGPIPE